METPSTPAPPWIALESRRTHRRFFYNPRTGESASDIPPLSAQRDPDVLSAPLPPLPAPWEERHSKSSRKTYFYNPFTGESSALHPSSPGYRRRKAAEGLAAAKSSSWASTAVYVDKQAEAVARAYGAEEDEDGAYESPIRSLRQFQNWIKALLIKRVPTPVTKVLDLACGKLGDLSKWRLAEVKEYVGIDISEGQVLKGAERFRSATERQLEKKPHSAPMEARLIVADLGVADLRSTPALPADEQFDAISIQFAIHYLFGSEVGERLVVDATPPALHPSTSSPRFLTPFPFVGFLCFRAGDGSQLLRQHCESTEAWRLLHRNHDRRREAHSARPRRTRRPNAQDRHSRPPRPQSIRNA